MNIKAPRRLAVFSDIHANLHALQAVLAAIDELGITTLVCCGDVVGYGAYPNECIEIMRQRQIPTLAGNHDHAAIGLTDIEFFNEIAREAILWTAEELTPENALWLRERPYTYEMDGEFFFVHASPFQPEQWGYVLTFGDARVAFEQFSHQFGFIGHSHQPAVVVLENDTPTCPEEAVVPIEEGCRYLINVGSVGQPRDRNPHAAFVTVDLETKAIKFHRVVYPVREAQAAIRRAGLPYELAERLQYGW